MTKFLKMNETVIDMETGVDFIKGRLYEVIFEADDYYQISNRHSIICGIDKSLEGMKYDVIEKE